MATMRPIKLAPACALFVALAAINAARHQALPYQAGQQIAPSAAAAGAAGEQQASIASNANSSSNEINNNNNNNDNNNERHCAPPATHDCQEAPAGDELEAAGRQLAPQVVACLTSCANCVKQWRAGVYDGHSCARDCLEQERADSPPDPDCSLLKYFNATALASVAVVVRAARSPHGGRSG